MCFVGATSRRIIRHQILEIKYTKADGKKDSGSRKKWRMGTRLLRTTDWVVANLNSGITAKNYAFNIYSRAVFARHLKRECAGCIRPIYILSPQDTQSVSSHREAF